MGLVVAVDVILDCGGEFADAAEGAAANALRVISANQRSIWFSQDELVGVK